MKKLKCYLCKRKFIPTKTQKEFKKEHNKNFPKEDFKDSRPLCGECAPKFWKWYNKNKGFLENN